MKISEEGGDDIYYYNQIILSLSQQQSGRFQIGEVGQLILESTKEIGHHMYQET